MATQGRLQRPRDVTLLYAELCGKTYGSFATMIGGMSYVIPPCLEKGPQGRQLDAHK